MPVITIGRQFGAGGEPVGRIIARRLKADLLDNEIMTEVARRAELPTDEVEAQDENPGSFLNRLLTALRADSEGVSANPVRLFTIAYGHDADKDVLRQMSEATNAASYDASDPQTINKVFTAVISNF